MLSRQAKVPGVHGPLWAGETRFLRETGFLSRETTPIVITPPVCALPPRTALPTTAGNVPRTSTAPRCAALPERRPGVAPRQETVRGTTPADCGRAGRR